MEDFLRVVSSLNDETRIRLLRFIDLHARVCVCDIENSFGMIQSRVSRHLKILKDAGFLRVEREGRWAYFSLESLDDFKEDMLKHIRTLDITLPELVRNCKV